jgi:dihydrolipoamide dehydrogenase
MALVTIGRDRLTRNIGAEEAGVEFGDGNSVKVNDFLQTNIPEIYAIGDITGHFQLAHLASRQGVLAADHAAGKEIKEPINYDAVPACVFTSKPVAYVGKGAAELDELNVEYKSTEFLYRALGISHAKDELEGTVWLVAEKDTDRVLSGGVYGYGAPELVHTIGAAVANSLTVQELNRVVFAHPTFAESIGESLEALHFQAIHS